MSTLSIVQAHRLHGKRMVWYGNDLIIQDIIYVRSLQIEYTTRVLASMQLPYTIATL